MSRRTDLLLALGIVIATLSVAGLVAAANWSAEVPPGAAMNPIARAAASGAGSPTAQQCLARITNASGYMDLCWSVSRSPDGDPVKDYYTLRLYGTVGGSGAGIRWWALRADLEGEPGDSVFLGWPMGTHDGPCEQQEVPSYDGTASQATETVCGRTIGRDAADWAYLVQWTCVGCVLPDHSDRGLALYTWVGVPQGATPRWDIGADFGG